MSSFLHVFYKHTLVCLEGSRPKTWIATIAPVAIGMGITAKVGKIDFFLLGITFFSALFLQIGTNFSNDYLDYLKGGDKPRRYGPRRLAQSGILSVEKLKILTAISFALSLLLASYLTYIGGIIIALIALLGVFFGFLYTATRYSLAYLGLADFFVFMFFGPIATAGTVYLQTGTFSFLSVLVGFAPGSLSTALLVANNLRDRESDRQAKKKTIIVRFGKKVGCLEYLFCLFVAAMTPIAAAFLLEKPLLCLLTFLFPLLAFLPIRTLLTAKSSSTFLPLLPQTALLLTGYTFLFLLLCLW